MKTDSLPEMIKAGCMTCAIPVLLFLAFANTFYGQGVDANGNNLPMSPLVRTGFESRIGTNLSGGVESRHAASSHSRRPLSVRSEASAQGQKCRAGTVKNANVDERTSSGSSAPPAQNTLAIRHGKTESESFAALRGSDVLPKPSRQTLSTVQPTGAACPESAAELYARLCDQEIPPWTEPTPIPIPLPKPSELLSMQLP